MKKEFDDLMAKNSIFVWISLATVAMLLMVFAAMQFTAEVRWNEADFIVMGCLLLGTASLFVLVARRTARKHRMVIGMLFLAVFLYVWAELAVGIFTNLGS